MRDGRDEVEKVEVVRSNNTEDLHLRYIGTAKGRSFIVNIQFDPTHRETGEALLTIEHSFMVARILRLVMKRVTERPDANLH